MLISSLWSFSEKTESGICITFISSKRKEDASRTNNGADPGEMKAKLSALYDV